MTRFTLCLFAVVISINCTADDSSALIKTLHELTNVFNRDDVRKELEVLDDQAQEIAIHGKENNRRLKELESQLDLIPSEEFIRRIKEFSSQMGAENEAKRKEVLLPFQLRRLDELTWQYRSLDEPIRAYDLAVQLSEEQKTRMRSEPNCARNFWRRCGTSREDRNARFSNYWLPNSVRSGWRRSAKNLNSTPLSEA